MMKDIRIAVLMTCHNRRNLTLDCLSRLYSQDGIQPSNLEVFLVDDGSIDGTAEGVKNNYPEVRILKGDGNLFWCGGMRLAFGEALKEGYDFYLWLNDDTKLFDSALRKLIATYDWISGQIGNDVIIAGSLCDDESRQLTYGGSNVSKWWRPTKYQMVQPSVLPRRCDLFHGNCVLIPSKVAMLTGNMSESYKHGPGDKDYALRAAKSGFSSWICAGFIGTCSRNGLLDRWKDMDLSKKERLAALNHPVVRARVEDWIVYTKKYHKFLWPSFYVRSCIRMQFPQLYLLLKSRSFFAAESKSAR